jgi:hypothetical protein
MCELLKLAIEKNMELRNVKNELISEAAGSGFISFYFKTFSYNSRYSAFVTVRLPRRCKRAI